jgi:CubicO group peptidase (beta-lactamase class C family)
VSKNIEDMSGLLEKHFKKSGNSIISIGIGKQDTVNYYNFNHKSDDQEIIFGLGSISKTFIGSYLAKLVYENKISLDDTLDKYFELNDKIAYPTILQLATHTSGYSFFIPRYPTLKVMLLNGFNKKNIYKDIEVEWIFNYLKKHKPSKSKKYRYSDFNYSVLAFIIESIEARPYKEVIVDYIRNDIGLKQTSYYNLKTSTESSYSWIWEDDNPFLAAGGLYSTISDMMKYLIYQNDPKNKYLSISHGKEVKINMKNVFSGFSWNSFYSGKFYWHIGGQGYFRSYTLFDKKREISIVILATVDINLQHIGRLGSVTYRNLKRNHNLLIDFLDEFI